MDHSVPLAHLMGHLTKRQRELAPWFLEPLTLDQIAWRVCLSRSGVEQHWRNIRQRLGLGSDHWGLARIDLLRQATGLERCFCER